MTTRGNAFAPYSKAHRRRDIVELPAEGCDLPVPKPPPIRVWSTEERAIWRELWRSPQATQWDDSLRLAVAMYVAHAADVLRGTGSATQATEARQLADSLGLTPYGMARLGWTIAGAESGEASC